MSLQVLAQDMAARGRGPDTQLIHMSPREVAGLQALAMAHGGSLSINPETGLPEAGFLDNLLPMILGIGAMALTGGAAAPAMTGLFGLGMPATIGLGVGALQTARTGDLGKGLMAGLGAYGGAGLAGGLMAAGGAGAGAGAGAANTAAMESMGSALARDQAAAAALNSSAPAMAGITGSGAVNAAAMESMGSALAADQAAAAGLNASTPTMAGVTGTPPSAFSRNLSQMGQGVRNLAEPFGREAFMGQAASKGAAATGVGGGMGLLKYGAAAGLPMLLDEGEDSAPAPVDREQMRFAYNPGRVENPMTGYPADYRGEYAYFRPTFTRLADGGPVEAMSAANVYDMQNARGGVSDMGVDMSTGMQRMADGGLSGFKPLSGYGDENRSSYSYDPARRSYANSIAALSDLYKYTYDPTTQQYTQAAPPAPPAAGAATSNGGQGFDGGGGDFGGGGFGAGVGDGAVGGAGDVGGGGGSHGLGGDGSVGGWAAGGLSALARGGVSHLGDYSDGGRLLRGPGDGVSDSIPAVIGQRRPARLADGEFVIPARIVSELGNGSTEAGARKLYAMMDRVQRARGKTTGKGKVAKNTRSDKYLPA